MSQSNLTEAFGASARDLVRPGQRPVRQDQPPVPEPSVTEVQHEPATPPSSEESVGPPQEPAEKPSRPEDSESDRAWDEQAPALATSQSIVYLAPGLRDTLDAARKRDRRTNADLVLDALDRARHQLPELVTRQQRQERPPNSLFSARPSRTRQRATSPAERTVPFTYRVTADELVVIDRLVEETNASSRSSLVAAALQATYARRPRRKR